MQLLRLVLVGLWVLRDYRVGLYLFGSTFDLVGLFRFTVRCVLLDVFVFAVGWLLLGVLIGFEVLEFWVLSKLMVACV